jgi:hypothetical protein
MNGRNKIGDGHFKKRNAHLDFENAQLKGYGQ